MRSVYVLRAVIACLALVFSLVRLALTGNWPIHIFEIALAFVVFLTIALLIYKKRAASKSNGLAKSGGETTKVPNIFVEFLVLSMSIWVAYMGTQFFLGVIQSRQLSRDEQHWPTTNATILGNALRSIQPAHGGQTWSPEWAYIYSTDGRTYRGRSMALTGGFDAHWYLRKSDAVLAAQSRPDSSIVAVYFDPADPSRSVLVRRTRHSTEDVLLMISVVLMMFPIGAFTLAYVSRKKRRPADQQFLTR